MNPMKKKTVRILFCVLLVAVLVSAFSMTAFPVCDMILAILFFVKVGTAYFDYRKHGQFEFAAPCILFACLIFTLTAPLYIWSII